MPVYKVESYLPKCLDSIVNQTYQNLEIILIDDGSPDRCGEICDEYAKRDNRIVVIHKENGGVSSARNVGLKLASGEYIGWVDSDDWVEKDMFAYLLNGLQSYDADIAVCGQYECFKNRIIPCGCNEIRVLDTRQAIHWLLENQKLKNYVWDKLCKKELYDGIQFPEGRAIEDVAVTYHLFEKANCVVCLPKKKYYYLKRNDSITNKRSIAPHMDCYHGTRRRMVELSSKYPELRPLLEAQCLISAVPIWCNYFHSSRAERKKYAEEIQEISSLAKSWYRRAMEYGNTGITGQIVLRLMPYPYWWAFLLSGWVGFASRIKNKRW